MFDFYRTCLNVEGARRIRFKVFIHIFADMGVFVLRGTKTDGLFRLHWCGLGTGSWVLVIHPVALSKNW